MNACHMAQRTRYVRNTHTAQGGGVQAKGGSSSSKGFVAAHTYSSYLIKATINKHLPPTPLRSKQHEHTKRSDNLTTAHRHKKGAARNLLFFEKENKGAVNV
jgi:hypothetical protein